MTPLDASKSDSKKGGPSFTLFNRLYRTLWDICWTLFGIWTPTPMFWWRRMILRLFGSQIHQTARIYPMVKIWYPPNLEIGEYSCLARGVNCYCIARVRIGNNSIVSQGAHLCTGDHDIDNITFQLVANPIDIRDNCWVAAEAFVGPGVVIEDGAVLGARAVMFGRMRTYGVYSGNPAKYVRTRDHLSFEQ